MRKKESLLNMFYSRVVKNPDKVAIKFENKTISYKYLDICSNQFAHYLLQKGIGKGELVGIYMERCIEAVICILGVLKIGAAYLPLDPFHPWERNCYIIKDSKMQLLVTQRQFINRMELNDDVSICCIDNESKNQFHLCGDKTNIHIDDDMVAYVIYTSGSTGFPKGVVIQHKALNNLLLSMRERPGISEDDVLLSVTTLSFDISILEIFLPLISGGSIVIANRETVLDGKKIAAIIDKEDITIMQATPITWRMLLEAGWKGKEELKILCGGEAMSVQLASQLINKCNSLWNMYGPTETTIWSSVAKIDNPQYITLGNPINETYYYVLDDNMQKVNIGEEGILFIGGTGLAKEYLYNPELTDDKFVRDPFSESSEKIYNTGDLVLKMKDGSLQYVGRTDFQVKIRGFRIELGEIECLAEQNTDVEQAVAIVKHDGMNNPIIVLYYKTNLTELDEKKLKHWLKNRIPEYMMPSFLVKVEHMPLTGNRKIDRNALALVEHNIKKNNKVENELYSDLEKELIYSWENILKIEGIAVDDDFFDLGGHSLLASRIVAKIKEIYNVEISLLEFLTEGYTISKLIEIIKKKRYKGKQ